MSSDRHLSLCAYSRRQYTRNSSSEVAPSQMSLTRYVSISIILTGISLISANVFVACPKELFQQKIVCDPGQALSAVTWSETSVPNCRRFRAKCMNATTSCTEHCEWNARCRTNESVSIDTLYVRGIDIQYEMMEEVQTVSFLCCHSEDLKTGILECDQRSFIELKENTHPNLISIMVQAATKNLLGDLPFEVSYCPVLNIPTCPPEKVRTNFPKIDAPPHGGGGGGGGGLTVRLAPCFGPSGLIAGLRLSGHYQFFPLSSATACMDYCATEPYCNAMTYHIPAGTCFLFHVKYILGGGPYIGYIKCVTPSDYFTLESLG